MKKYKNLKEFYPYYLTEHAGKQTKLFHFIGTALSIFFSSKIFIYSRSNECNFCVTFWLWFCMG